VAFGALVFSGCLSTGYAYVSHRNPDKTELFFKVPTSWKFFNQNQIILASNPHLSLSQLSQIEGSRWLDAFTSAPHPKAKNALNLESNYPTGEAFARPLNPSERQTYSLTSLRTEILSSDPLAANSPDTVLAYTEFTGKNGLRGSRMEVDVPIASNKFITLEQVAEVDQDTNWVFLMAVSCTATCWRPNAGVIKQIFNSWSVKPVGGG
jgi:hypothetical protein